MLVMYIHIDQCLTNLMRLFSRDTFQLQLFLDLKLLIVISSQFGLEWFHLLS